MHSYEDWVGKIALGTVQFGLDYGISNQAGLVAPATVSAILHHAHTKGVRTLDTAAAYGTSEEVLGANLRESFTLISKLPPDTPPERFEDELQNSLRRLRARHLYGYMAHRFADFQQEALRQEFYLAREQKWVEKIGVSVYHLDEVRWLLGEQIDFDLIQLPFNVFDQRFRACFGELKARGVEIHARSAFLQGLFFLPTDALPAHFFSVRKHLESLLLCAESAELPMASLLLNYAMAQEEIDKVVIGVVGIEQLQQNLDAHRDVEKLQPLRAQLDAFALTDEHILLPFLWRT